MVGAAATVAVDFAVVVVALFNVVAEVVDGFTV